MLLRVDLPYPHKLLWPNGRTRSFHAKADKVRKHREWGYFGACAALGRRIPSFNPFEPIPVRIIVSRKSSGVYPDRDNSVAAAKSYLDGIADRLGVNDRLFGTPEVEFIAPITGRFVIVLGTPEAGAPA